jgi:hypothetical protein
MRTRLNFPEQTDAQLNLFAPAGALVPTAKRQSALNQNCPFESAPRLPVACYLTKAEVQRIAQLTAKLDARSRGLADAVRRSGPFSGYAERE